jgi:hypothetical protein
MPLQDEVKQPVAMLFHYSTTMQVGDGKRTLFWADRWIHGQSVAELAPCLVQAVPKRILNRHTIFEGLQDRRWVRDISGALALYERCWTATRRKRHGLQDDDACALCDQEPETVSHLLLTCSFSRTVWHLILARIGMPAITPTRTDQSLATGGYSHAKHCARKQKKKKIL